MNRHKDFFFKITSPLVNVAGVNSLMKISDQRTILPLYHTVADVTPIHLKYLYIIRSVANFKNDLDYLLKIARPVELSELIDHVKDGKVFKFPVFHLTFDDGLREFHDIISPILLQKGVPATCFLNSAFIDNKELFFRFKAGILINILRKMEKDDEKWTAYHYWLKSSNLKVQYYQKVLLSVGYQKKILLDDLAQVLGVDFSEYLQTNKPYLDSNQITSLIKQGFTFGAHSIDHPEFRFIAEEEQIHQIVKSIETVSSLFHLPYNVFSFPFTDHGLNKHFFKMINEKSKIDLTFGCAGMKLDSFPFNVQRIPVEISTSPMRGIIKKELMYFILLKMIGKHVILR